MSKYSDRKLPKIGNSRIIKENLIYRGNWIEAVELDYEDEKKCVRKWEGLHRKNKTNAVIIVAKLKPSNRYILVRQFRPPTKSYILEFPAGLVDSGENIEIAAIRELLEETGYSGKIENKSPKLFSSPGIISEAVYFVYINVDESDKKNQNPITKQEPDEFITVILKYPEEIMTFFKEESNRGVFFDAKLYAYFFAKDLL